MSSRSRTQNNQEAWHGAFATNIKRCPEIVNLIEYIQKEQKSTERSITQCLSGQIWPQTKKQRDRDELILAYI